ncbi:hypothetical protein RhiJN_05276 [Ceratobasidium sp. AG-Ba]|nr:hypothetical protein RhiJN_05276 [Ceratobasidium sp. AG-Ba]QRW06193.1 hypothetical protein RhiLY_05192 [Ceratobasidium sp. AG-Ba]
MSRVQTTEDLGRGRRPHKPTEAHKAHVERVERSEQRREAIRHGKSVRNGESSPDYTDEDLSDQEEAVGARGANAGGAGFDPIEDELNRDEAIRQALIKKIRKYDNRAGLDTLDVDELEVIWKDIDDTRKARKKTMFDYSSKVQDNGPARPAIAPPKGSASTVISTASRKRARSPLDREHARKRVDTHEESHYPSPAQSSPRRRAQSSGRPASQPPASSSKRRSSSAYHDRRSPRSTSRSRPYNRRRSPSRSRIHSRSSSPGGRYSDLDLEHGDRSEEEDDERLETHAKKRKKNAERSKLGNYTGVERELIDQAFAILVNQLYGKHPFPDTQKYVQLIHQSWAAAKVALKIHADKYPLDKGHKETLRQRVNSSHGHLRDHVRDQMENCFPFHDGSMTEQEIIDKVKRLLPHGIHQKPGSEPKTGYYGHPWIKRVIFKAFFVGRSPIGTKFPDDWNPIPLKIVAIVCGIMGFLVEQWIDGKLPEVEDRAGRGKGVPRGPRMSFADVETKYREQYKFLKDMAKNGQGDRRDILLYEMYTSCMKGARVKRAASDSAEVQPVEQRDNRHMFVADHLSREERARLASLRAAKTGIPAAQDREAESDDEHAPAAHSEDENGSGAGGGSDAELGWGDTNADDDILAPTDKSRSATPAGTARPRAKPVLRALAASAPGLRGSPEFGSPSGSSVGSRVQSPCPPLHVAGKRLAALRGDTNNALGDFEVAESTRDRRSEGPNTAAIKSVVSRLEVVIPVGTPSQRWKELNEGVEVRNAKGPRASGSNGRLKIRKSAPSASQP